MFIRFMNSVYLPLLLIKRRGFTEIKYIFSLWLFQPRPRPEHPTRGPWISEFHNMVEPWRATWTSFTWIQFIFPFWVTQVTLKSPFCVASNPHFPHVKPIQLLLSNRFEINTLYISEMNTKPAISLKLMKKDLTKLYIFYWIKNRR